MIKVLAFIKRRPDLDQAAFRDYYEHHHAPLVNVLLPYYQEYTRNYLEEPFRRGFPYFIQCQTKGKEWTAAEVKRVATELTKLVRTTTIRGFYPYETPINRLTELLKAPVIGELTSLGLSPDAIAIDK